ncbi:probable DctQ (C4-dicarboxylate permease, small subunit) [Desulfotalea psychrophila LSv54]|uniref:Probable DctQ (C4-dicarboxylate permease, small subunit) n=2 Tax=Desulfotalea psychrophila TaxID=84980 RepID=Q6AQP8_DESPS|nr:probable DctQ (C4-dicarboxylate permease, small subunit) [Desulfotalea psychrophila LSv54]
MLFIGGSRMLKKVVLAILDGVESYMCQILLAFFVLVLFLQIIMREIGIPLSWSEEVSRYSFVWFVFFGASYAARLGAHNRVTLQFNLFPKWVSTVCFLLSDAVWLWFNAVLIYKGCQEIQFLREFPYATPALDWQLWVVYLVFPLSFGLMSIRIIQVDYIKFVLGKEIMDPDKAAVEESKKTFAHDDDSASDEKEKSPSASA